LTKKFNNFDLQGHRGARGLAPENTVSGCLKALSIGVHTIELDVAITKDNQVVVVHDPKINPDITRKEDGKWLSKTGPKINCLTLEQVKKFDVGRINPKSLYATKYPTQIPSDGDTIPTLREIFELIHRLKNEKIRFNIELKFSPEIETMTPSPKKFALRVLDIIKSHNMVARSTVQCFDWRPLKVFRELDPGIMISYLTAQQNWMDTIKIDDVLPSAWLAGIDLCSFGGSIAEAISFCGGNIWAPFYQDVTPENIEAAHNLNLLVKVWTVNDHYKMNELIDMNVDGIITDYPNILRKVMEKRGMDVPPSFQIIEP
jgi:glycerophosphoryl diester phosphodiesterase